MLVTLGVDYQAFFFMIALTFIEIGIKLVTSKLRVFIGRVERLIAGIVLVLPRLVTPEGFVVLQGLTSQLRHALPCRAGLFDRKPMFSTMSSTRGQTPTKNVGEIDSLLC